MREVKETANIPASYHKKKQNPAKDIIKNRGNITIEIMSEGTKKIRI